MAFRHEKLILKLFKSGDYYCTKDGRVFSKKRKTREIGWALNTGYVGVTFRASNQSIASLAHRAVYMFFNGAIKKGLEINHKNGVVNDNRLSNLELVTKSEQAKHAFKTGLHIPQKGEEKHNAKLNNKNILMIRKMLGKKSHSEIAEVFGVKKGAIWKVSSGRSWGHVK